MLFVIALVIAFSFAFLCGRALKNHPYIFYVSAAFLTVGMSFLPSFDTHNISAFVNNYILGLFTRGAFATALWCVVMITGALPNGSAPIKKLMPVRGELSIFTAILTLGHNIGYGRTYFVMMFTNSERMSSNQIAAGICTIIMLVIMIPLAVMSFPQIRRKMNAKLWKKIQRTAYIFYTLIYVHVMLLTVPMAKMGRKGYLLSVMIYSIVFIGYAVCRIRKYLIVSKKTEKSPALNISCIAAYALIVVCIPMLAKSNNITANAGNIPAETTEATKETTASSVLETSEETTVITTATEIETSLSDTEVSDESSETEESETEEEQEDEEQPDDEEYSDDDDYQEDNALEREPEAEPEPQYIYNNGEFSASAYGYDGEVYVTVTIENDVIISITGYSEESDSWYFDSASDQIFPAIIDSQDTDVDTYSGATYSSDAIMKAVRAALEDARK